MVVRKKQKGFSLLEVACIFAIMGLMAMMAIPSISNVKRQEVSEFVSELSKDLALAYQSIKTNDTEQCTLTLISDSSGSKYIGYKLVDSKGFFIEKERGGIASFDVKVYKGQGTGSLWSDASKNIFYLTKEGILDTLPPAVGSSEKIVTFEILNEKVSKKWYVTFYCETGYYEIYSIDA